MKRDIFDRIMSLPGLKILYPWYEKHKETLLYLFFGGCTTLVSIATFWAFSRMMDPLVANILSWVIAVGFAYVTNRTWVFRSTAKGKAILKEFGAFYGGRLLTLGLEEGILLAGITLLKIFPLPVKIFAQILVLAGNYVISKLLIFRKK